MNTKFTARYLLSHRACKSRDEVKLLTFYPQNVTTPITLRDILYSELDIADQLHWLVYHCLDKKELNQLLGLFVLIYARWGNLGNKEHYQMVGLMLEDSKTQAASSIVERKGDVSESLNNSLHTYLTYFLQGDNYQTSAVRILHEVIKGVAGTDGHVSCFHVINIIAETYKIPTFKQLFRI